MGQLVKTHNKTVNPSHSSVMSLRDNNPGAGYRRRYANK